MKIKCTFSLDDEVVSLIKKQNNRSLFVNTLLRKGLGLEGQGEVEALVKKAVAKEIAKIKSGF